MRNLQAIAVVCVLFFGSSAQADWTSFRNGGASTTGDLPMKWSPKSISWQVELSGYGQSAPVVHGRKIFVASVVGGMKEKCLVQCIDLKSGAENWRFEFPSSRQAPSNYRVSRAAPTPVVDQDGVYIFFESGDLAAFNLSGKLLWQRDLCEELGEFDNHHGLGSSPAQSDSQIFLNLEHKGPSHLVAIRKRDGSTDWKVERPSGSSWSSPIFTTNAGEKPQVVVSSGGTVNGYDASNGSELWSMEGLDGNTVPSPTLHGNRLFVGARLPEFADEGNIRSNCCLDISMKSSDSPETLWRADKAISDYASPVVAGEFVYFINKVGVLHCLDIGSGKLHFRKRLNGPCWATPIATSEHLYVFCKDGSTQVVQVGKDFKSLASNHLWDPSAPPQPERYVEFNGAAGGGHGAEKQGASAKAQSSSAKPDASPAPRRPGGGMIAALMRGDANGDGILEGDEVPTNFRPMLTRIDKNKDGKLDRQEIDAMAKSFAERRAGARAGARDPIVYGVAASNGFLIIRTGTRLYCIHE